MSRARHSGGTRARGARRSRGGSHTRSWLLLVVVLVAAGGVGYVRYRRPVEAVWTRLMGVASGAARRSSPPPAGAPAARGRAGASAAAGCWSPEATLHGQAVALAKQARFETIEQLTKRGAALTAPAYRVPARLVEYFIAPDQAYVLRLSSLVDPQRTIEARLPAGRCVGDSEDAGLFDELREDINLRFGRASRQPVKPATPEQVVVTGVATGAGAGVQLAPVLDVQVQ